MTATSRAGATEPQPGSCLGHVRTNLYASHLIGPELRPPLLQAAGGTGDLAALSSRRGAHFHGTAGGRQSRSPYRSDHPGTMESSSSQRCREPPGLRGPQVDGNRDRLSRRGKKKKEDDGALPVLLVAAGWNANGGAGSVTSWSRFWTGTCTNCLVLVLSSPARPGVA